MTERLTKQARIDLGPDDISAHDSPQVIAAATGAREHILTDPYLEKHMVADLIVADVDTIGAMVATGTLLAYEDHETHLFPAFQFDLETRKPFDVVRQINLVLDAPNDGWGVTAWWIQRNTNLPAGNGTYQAPVELLENPDLHDSLLALAQAVGQSDSY